MNDTTEAALRARAGILAMTDAAETAVLRPQAPGAWSHALRAALAARCARLCGLDDLAGQYATAAAGDPAAALADPAEDGAELGLAHVTRFMDLVAASPRDVKSTDISGLQAAGVSDADIVRLAELNAFLAYRLRLAAGLRLLEAAP